MLSVASALFGLLATVHVPDIIPAGSKGVRVESRLELGPLARLACLSHVVVQGETLGAIANQKLGSAERWKEIAALNPSLEPTKLRVGEELWLPAVGPLSPGEEPVFLFFDAARRMMSGLRPLRDDGGLSQSPRYGQLTLYIVPQASKAAFDEALAERKTMAKAVEALLAAGTIRQLAVGAPSRLVERRDPTARRVDTYRVEQPKDGAPTLVLASSECFDADDKPIVKDATAEDEKRKQDALLLLLFAGAGGAGLWLLRARGRSPAQLAPASPLAQPSNA